MRRAVGYVRVSTGIQAEDGKSIASQRDRVEAWAKAHGCEAVVYSDEGLSGGRADNRPGLQRAISDACEHKGVLVVYCLSRLARNTVDALAIAALLRGSGADLVSLSEQIDTNTPAGKLMFTFLSAFAEFEREMIRARIGEGVSRRRAEGLRIGGNLPYGFRADTAGKLHRDPGEMAVVSRILAMSEQGTPAHGIGAALNRERVLSRTGRMWSSRTVIDVILRHSAGSGGEAAS